MQMDSTVVSTKLSLDNSEMSVDTHVTGRDSPIEQVKENGTSASVQGFKEWFQNNKAKLECEFPGMKTAQLKKEAVKKFKVEFS